MTVLLGQRQKSLFPAEMKDFSDEDYKAIEAILPGSSEIIQEICHNIHWYQKSVEQKDAEGIVRDYKLVNEGLDKLGGKEGELWIYLIIYCDGVPAFLDAFHALRRKFHPDNFPMWRPRPAVEAPSGRPPPFSLPQFPPPPSPVPTIAPRPMPTSIPVAQLPAMLPRYTDVMTPSTPQYGRELQEQITSYRQRWADFYGGGSPVATIGPSARPFPGGLDVMAPQQPIRAPGPLPTPSRPPMPPLTPTSPVGARPFQIAPRPGGAGTPFPGAPVATRPTCPPGQFWDGRQCRGSVGPMPGGFGAAAGAGGATMGPSSLPGAGPTFAMASRPSYRPAPYRAALAGSPALGQTFDEILGLSPEVGDILRLVYHGGGTWLGFHVAMANGKTPWLSAIGWMIAGGMGIAGVLDVVSLLKRACGTHP